LVKGDENTQRLDLLFFLSLRTSEKRRRRRLNPSILHFVFTEAIPIPQVCLHVEARYSGGPDILEKSTEAIAGIKRALGNTMRDHVRSLDLNLQEDPDFMW
jgi:hypothetical protein